MSVTSVNQDVFAAQTGMSVTATAAEGEQHHHNQWGDYIKYYRYHYQGNISKWIKCCRR